MKKFLKISFALVIFTSLTSCFAMDYGYGYPGGGTVVISTGGYARPYYGRPHYGGYGHGGGYGYGHGGYGHGGFRR